MITENEFTVSNATIKCHLDTTRFCAWVLAEKPLNQSKNKKIEMKFSKKHEMWTIENCKNVFWRDQSKLNLFESNYRRYSCRPKCTRIDPWYNRPH